MINNVREGEELNQVTLKNYLFNQKLIENTNSKVIIQQFSNGYSNLTYLVSTPEKDYVLRRPPFGAVKKGHDMSREYKVLSQLSQHFSKVPKTYAFCDDDAVLGADFYLMEKVEGIVINLKKAKELSLSSKDFKGISTSWLQTFVELHSLDYDEIELSDLGKPDGYVERQVNTWTKQYLKAATDDLPAAQKVMKWMSENQPREYDHSLIHNDYKYDNLIYENDKWDKVKAILDWEMCTLGDPLMDLGTSLAYWITPSDGPALAQGLPSPTIMEGNPSRNEVVEMYASASGKNINNLTFYYVYGLFKIAVIAQQIYYRYHKGYTTNKKFANLNQSCAFLCLMASQAIDKDQIENLF